MSIKITENGFHREYREELEHHNFQPEKYLETSRQLPGLEAVPLFSAGLEKRYRVETIIWSGPGSDPTLDHTLNVYRFTPAELTVFIQNRCDLSDEEIVSIQPE